MTPRVLLGLAGLLAALGSATEPAVAQSVNCGVFDADFVIVRFRVTGGGTDQRPGGEVLIVQDDFHGVIHFRKSRPDDECAQPVDILPFTAVHHYQLTDRSGGKVTLDLAGSTNRAGMNIPLFAGGVNPVNKTWFLLAAGAYDGTEVRTYPPSSGVPTLTTPLRAVPWNFGGVIGQSDQSIIPNFPIPTTDPATISHQVSNPAYPGLRWNVQVTVRRGPSIKKWLDPCYVGGSIIGCEDQSLGESIPITGIPLRLHYRSDRFGAPNAASAWTHRALSVAGWSLTIHHSWDPSTYMLYLGDGSTRGPVVETIAAGANEPPGSILISGRGGDEVFLFDATGRHLKTIDGLTRALRYEFLYGPSGSLTSIRDRFGRDMTIERDASGRPMAITTPDGDRTSLATNAQGLLASVANPAGTTWRLDYSTSGLLTSFTDGLGQVHRYDYDGAGRLVRDVSPSGHTVTLTRKGTDDNDTEVTVRTNAQPATTFQVTRVGTDVTRSIAFPDGSRTTAQLSAGETTATMPDGATMTATDGADPEWGTVGNPSSQVLTTPGGLSRSVTTSVSVIPALPNVPFLKPGREIVTSVDGKEFRSFYGTNTRTHSITSPLGRSLSVEYDPNGLPATMMRAGLAPVGLTHDQLGRVTEMRSGPTGQERRVRFTYDRKGRLETVVNPLGQTRQFTYDQLNRLVAQSFGGNETRFTYDALGRMTAFQPPGRPAHQLQYTPDGTLAAYLPPTVAGAAAGMTYTYASAGLLSNLMRLDGRSVKFARNAAGQITSAATTSGILSIQRDATTGRLSETVSASAVRTAFSWDGPLLTSITYGGAIKGSVTMHYGTSLKLEGVSVAGEPPNAYKYDDDGLLIGSGEQDFTRDAQSGLLVASSIRSVTAEWKYNGFGEVASHEERLQATPFYQVAYTRDALGRIVRKAETINGASTVHDYEFDMAGRLSRALRGGREYARYEYDANGNRTRAVYPSADVAGVYDDQDRLLSLGGARYAYNGHGELQTRSDAGGTAAFVFDELGELRSVKTAAGRLIEYLVDADGKRVGRRVDGAMVDSYLYDADGKLVAWYDGSGGLRAIFIYGRRRHVPESMLSGGALYRIVTDHVGSVRLVVDAASGQVAQFIDYDPFGRVLLDSKPGFQPFGFAGGLTDELTRLIRFGVRDYDPESGRWISQDPIYFQSGSTNFYQYAGNDPVNRSDPRGLWSAEVSFGFGSVSLTWESGVGLSGSIAIGATTPGVSGTPGGSAFVPADVETSDFLSRDTKVTVEGKAQVGISSLLSVSGTIALEQQADRYGIRCGPWGPTAKAEVCVLGFCMDTDAQTKADLGQIKGLGEGDTSLKAGASAEAVVKLEALIWSAR